MKKWEYTTIDMPKYSIVTDKEYSLQELLNEAGQKGWEVCGIASPKNLSSAYECFILKREIIQEYKHQSYGVSFGRVDLSNL